MYMIFKVQRQNGAINGGKTTCLIYSRQCSRIQVLFIFCKSFFLFIIFYNQAPFLRISSFYFFYPCNYLNIHIYIFQSVHSVHVYLFFSCITVHYVPVMGKIHAKSPIGNSPTVMDFYLAPICLRTGLSH